MLEAFGLEGKTALVTGAGTGLGHAMAKSLAQAGARVVMLGRRREVLEEAAGSIGERAFAHPFDITRLKEIEELIASLRKKYGKLDILINNAGVHCKKPVEETTNEDFMTVIHTHLAASFALTRAVAPMMKESGGSIIFISSMSAFLGMANIVAYSTAKAGINGMMRCLASELGMHGIRVNSIAPGFIDTPMLHRAIDGDQPRIDKILNRTPSRAFGQAEDIGWAAVYLASDAARFVNGQVLAVDGGALIGF
ncbi:MAG: SDR family oxidoreductase [Candidatus Accumulibacter sp.]|nr:SDR family oxidoreductase [Accumulibacter sp.]